MNNVLYCTIQTQILIRIYQVPLLICVMYTVVQEKHYISISINIFTLKYT
jgi:hypothetical protein